MQFRGGHGYTCYLNDNENLETRGPGITVNQQAKLCWD